MKFGYFAILTISVTACGVADGPTSNPDRIEISESSVWGGHTLTLNANGEASIARSDAPREVDFTVPLQQFQQVVSRLEQFRRRAVPPSEGTAAMMAATCPDNVPYMADAGAITVTWFFDESEQFYWADLECDYEKNARRNEELRAIIASVSVPPEA